MAALPQPFRLALGKAIRARRDELDISQLELAHEAGVNQSWISQVEAGKRGINLASLRKLAVALGLEDWELLRSSRSFEAEG